MPEWISYLAGSTVMGPWLWVCAEAGKAHPLIECLFQGRHTHCYLNSCTVLQIDLARMALKRGLPFSICLLRSEESLCLRKLKWLGSLAQSLGSALHS